MAIVWRDIEGKQPNHHVIQTLLNQAHFGHFHTARLPVTAELEKMLHRC